MRSDLLWWINWWQSQLMLCCLRTANFSISARSWVGLHTHAGGFGEKGTKLNRPLHSPLANTAFQE